MHKKFESTVQNFKKGIKPQGEIINTVFYRPLSYPIVLISAKLKLTPNFITFISLLSSIISAIFFGLGRVYLGALFLFLRQYLDCVDGALARMTNNFSKYGAMFDAIGDGVGVLIIIIAITIEQYLRLGESIVFIYLGLALISNVIGLIYHNSVKSRYFKNLRAGKQSEKISSKTNQNSLVNFFGFDSESEVKLNFIENFVKKIAPFPNIEKPMVRNSDNQEMTMDEKQQLFNDSFSFLPLLWSIMAGGAQTTAIITVSLFNRLDDLLWIVLIIGWNLLALPLSLIHHYSIRQFYSKIEFDIHK